MAFNGESASDSSAEVSRLTQLIGSNIQKIQSNVATIERLVDQIGTAEDNESVRGRLHEMQHATHDVAKQTNEMLKKLSNAVENNRQGKLQKDRLTNELMTVLTNVQRMQREAAAKEKASILRARANSGIPDNPFADEPALAPPPQPQLSSAKQLQIEQNVNLDELNERAEAIKSLESDIVDVNTIFKDLALMVHEQGEMVDSIEHNVESAVINVDQGSSNIQRASRYQTSLRKKKVICTVLIIILLIVLVLIIYFSVKN